MNNADLIKKAELELWEFIEIKHKLGLNYWQILRLILKTSLELMLKADLEWWIKRNE